MPVVGRKRPHALATAAAILALLVGARAQNRDARVAAPKGHGTITGRVEIKDAGSRAPLRRAAVLLIATTGPQHAPVATDADGRFRFEDLVPGRYRVEVKKAGFYSPSPPAEVELDSSDHAAVAIEVLRAGALEGRFIDDRGFPIERLPVTASLIGDAAAEGPRLYSAATDDLGRFRIHTLPPGRYRLHASPPSLLGQELFYPGTAQASEATVIAVEAGQTVQNLNVTVPSVSPSPEAADALAAIEREINAPESPGFDGRISGRVTRSDVDLPVPNATVNLLSSSGFVLRAVSTDGDGRFLFRRLPDARYSVSVNAPGFVSQSAAPQGSSGARGIAISKGSNVRLDIALLPSCAIEVSLVDEFGDPAPGVVLRFSKTTSTATVPLPIADSTGAVTGSTDDRGWFRAFRLTPGEYFVTALPEPFARSGPAAFAPTYFPGSATADAARTVRVGTGIEFSQVAFALVATATGPVSGIVVAEDGARVSNVSLALLPASAGSTPDTVFLTTVTAGNGTFVFRNVPEGAYVVRGLTPSGFGTVPVRAAFGANAEEAPVVLTLTPLRSARGRVVFDGDQDPAMTEMTILLGVRPVDVLSRFLPPTLIDTYGTATGPGWTFDIRGLAFRGVVVCSLRPTSPWVLARVMLQGRDITDVPYEFQTEDVDGLEVVLTNRVGIITGTVTDAGTAAPGVNVIVFGAESPSPLYVARTTRSTQTGERGTFQIPRLLPGRYFILATRILSVASARDDLRAMARIVTVTPGGRVEVSLPVVR